MVRMAGAVAAVLCLAVPLAACGKKAPPEPPLDKSGKKSDFPRAYPNPKSY